jgi:hypothetical protein
MVTSPNMPATETISDESQRNGDLLNMAALGGAEKGIQ